MSAIHRAWLCPLSSCNICGHTFGNGEGETPVMYGALVSGRWGSICERCFKSDPKAGVGIGRGQRYELQLTNNGTRIWVGVAGFE